MENRPLSIVYFTDPVCSTCWLTEPYLYRLKSIWGNAIDIEVRMGGLLPSLEQAQKDSAILQDMDRFVAWLEELEKSSGMHLDGNSWKTNPVSSSYPASIAFHAVKKSHPKKQVPFYIHCEGCFTPKTKTSADKTGSKRRQFAIRWTVNPFGKSSAMVALNLLLLMT